MVNKTTFIYGLFDPQFPEKIMYVGKGDENRAKFHWKIFKRNGKAVNAGLRTWLETISSKGIEPSYRFLEENIENWQERERYWIAYWKEHNPQLCNIDPGGNSVPIMNCKLGGKRVHEIHPDGARKRMFQTHKENPNLARETALKVHKLHPELSRNNQLKVRELYVDKLFEWASLGGKAGGKKGMHNRWHRKKFNPNCHLCLNQNLDFFAAEEQQQCCR
jgi:hypothetical protein